MKLVLGSAVFAAPLLMTLAASNAATVLTPIADAQVNKTNPNTNYGSAESVFGRRYLADEWKIYLKFELPGDAQTITDATIAGMQLSASQGGNGFVLHGMTNYSLNGWDESTITWNNAPANDTAAGAFLLAGQNTYISYSEPYSAPAGPSSRDYFVNTPAETASLVAFLNDALANGGGVVTFMLTSYEFGGGGPWVASKEQTGAGFEPVILSIDYVAVPEPASLAMLGAGALMLVRRKR